jgi:hypothetical protein
MNIADEYRIHLNFLPITGELPEFEIYRKLRADPQEKRPADDDIHCYSLPKMAANVEDRDFYWVSYQPKTGFEAFKVAASFNNNLTTWVFSKAIGEQCKQKLVAEDYWLSERGFLREVHFNIRRHDEGDEQLVVQPYYMRAIQKFGVLADFHFRKNAGVKFSRLVQQLSLSLDERFKRNLDFYVDRFDKINQFLKERRTVLSAIQFPGAARPLILGHEFESVPATRLRPRS